MAARLSSSDYASNSTHEKLVASDSSDDESSEVMMVRAERRATQAESSSFRGDVGTVKNLEAEASHMAGIHDFQITMRNPESPRDTKGDEIECACCYEKFQFENMVHCSKGHRFCCICVRNRVEQIIYGGLRAHASLSCMCIHYCTGSIPFSEIRRALPNDTIERYEDRQAQEAIAEAKLEGLAYCPFCNIPYIVDAKCVEVMDCLNPRCLKASCIQCKKLSHIPLQCEEVEEMSDTYLRRKVEERMSKAVIRECNICQAELIKIDGCNKVRCRCGNMMCYICRQTVGFRSSDHFCFCHFYSTVEPGKSSCKICNKCSMNENEVEDNEALVAKEEALKELAEKEPKLLDLVIGPPLKKLRQQTPTEEQAHHIQRPLQHLPLQRLRPNGIARPLPLPSPYFFRFGNGSEDANITGPPPHFFQHDD